MAIKVGTLPEAAHGVHRVRFRHAVRDAAKEVSVATR